MKLLSLDPATRSGWAWTETDDNNTLCYGVVDIGVSGSEHDGNKLVRFRDWLAATIARLGCDRLAFEDASFGSHNQNTKAFHNQLRGIIIMVAAELLIPFKAYKPNTIKKFATDNGNATKDQMIRACKTQFDIDTDDDNIADSLFILELAKQEAAGRRFEPAAKSRRPVRVGRSREKRLF